MSMQLIYGATTFTASRDPDGSATLRSFKSPSMRAGSGKLFVYNKSIMKDVVTLTWSSIDPTDLGNLLTFLDTVDYSSNAFNLVYTDFLQKTVVWDSGIVWDTGVAWCGASPLISWVVRYVGPNELTWNPADIMDYGFSIYLLISQP